MSNQWNSFASSPAGGPPMPPGGPSTTRPSTGKLVVTLVLALAVAIGVIFYFVYFRASGTSDAANVQPSQGAGSSSPGTSVASEGNSAQGAADSIVRAINEQDPTAYRGLACAADLGWGDPAAGIFVTVGGDVVLPTARLISITVSGENATATIEIQTGPPDDPFSADLDYPMFVEDGQWKFCLSETIQGVPGQTGPNPPRAGESSAVEETPEPEPTFSDKYESSLLEAVDALVAALNERRWGDVESLVCSEFRDAADSTDFETQVEDGKFRFEVRSFGLYSERTGGGLIDYFGSATQGGWLLSASLDKEENWVICIQPDLIVKFGK